MFLLVLGEIWLFMGHLNVIIIIIIIIIIIMQDTFLAQFNLV